MWAKLDDRRALNRKLRAAGLAARGLDEAAICQVAGDQTDGHITAETVEMLALAHGEKQWKRLVARLVEVGRWEVNGAGWDIHDYLHYNPSRKEIEQVRDKKRDAGRRSGEARRRTNNEHSVQHSVQHNVTGVVEQSVEPSRPVPSRINKTSSSSSKTTPAENGQTDDDDDPRPIVREAIRILSAKALTRRTQTANQPPVENRAAWLAADRRRRYAEHRTALAGLDLGCFASPEDLANHLEPAPVKRSTTTTTETTRAADEINYAHHNARRTSRCATCDGTGWVGETDVTRCRHCHGTGVAA